MSWQTPQFFSADQVGTRIKAISLWQPFATMIAWGFKQYETRSWFTDYRGTLIIQAAKTDKGMDYCNNPYVAQALDIMCEVPADLPFGAAVCVVDLVDCFRTEALRDQVGEHNLPLIGERERALGGWGNGRFAWKLANVRVLKPPVIMRGYQQIFDVDPEIRQRILSQIGAK